jgi:hypothetical protein
MAAAVKKGVKLAKPTKAAGTSMIKWEEELAKYADESAKVEQNTGNGLRSFSLKSGVLSIDDNAMPNNEMAVVILDHCLENTYYEEAYDPDQQGGPPSAYALGKDESDLRWSEDSIEEMETPNGTEKIAGQLCSDTWINTFGSAEKGRGKACRNSRRLLVIPAGVINKKTGEFDMIADEEHYSSVSAAFIKLPPTSITNFSVYVKSLSSTLRKPPFAVATRIKVVPDAKSQFKVTFEALEEMPPDLFDALVKRHKEAEGIIMQPYNMEREEVIPVKKPKTLGKRTIVQSKPVAKKTGRKY